MMVRRLGSWRAYFLWLPFALLLAFFAGCSEEPAVEEVELPPEPVVRIQEPEYQHLLPEEAKALLEREPATLVVDLRPQEEPARLIIPGAQPVIFEELINGRSNLPKDKPLLLVCSIGGKSYAASLVLKEAGYPWLYTLRGGMTSWQQAGLPLVNSESSQATGQ